MSGATMNKRTKRLGRPKGSKNKNTPVVNSELTACPKCKSTDRGPYTRTSRQELSDRVIIRRWCKCSKCGQCRIDRAVENALSE